MIYQDSKQPVDKRISDLLERMNLEEKAGQLSCIWPLLLIGEDFPDENLMSKYMKDGLGRITQFANVAYFDNPVKVAEFANNIQKFHKDNTRLGIPILFQSEASTGFLGVQATMFPTAMNLSSTWKPELIEDVGKIIREEMRAVGVCQALSPTIDIVQDPRWGRLFETYGEDPYLTSSMAVPYVRGIQGENLKAGVLSTAKHFLGYGVTLGGLNLAANRLNMIELYEVFARPFEAASRLANLESVMMTYVEINGQPAGANKEITQDLLRDKVGFNGHVLCEGNQVGSFIDPFGIAKDREEAAILAIEAGLDADTPVTQAYDKLPKLVREGKVQEELLDAAVERVLSAKFRLGLFENPYVDTGKVIEIYTRDSSKELSRKLAEDSIILLKNEGDLLPLNKDVESIAVIGPHGDNLRALFNMYSYPSSIELLRDIIKKQEGGQSGERMVNFSPEAAQKVFGELFSDRPLDSFIQDVYPDAKTVVHSVKEQVSNPNNVTYVQGCSYGGNETDGFEEAVLAAEKADIVILTLGDLCGWVGATCGEGKDATSLALPGVQQKLLEAVFSTGKPIILVLFNGRPYSINWAYENIPAILFVGFPGTHGGEAITKVLFGDVNPGGKLTMTVPQNVGQVPIYYYHKAASGYKVPNRENTILETFWGGYVDSPRTPRFHFGYGLSYTKFEFSNLKLDEAQVPSDGAIKISCQVKNIGERDGDEVVQLYAHDREARVTRPLQELIGYKRLPLSKGQSATVEFTIQMSQLGFTNEKKQFVVEPGNIDIMIGNSSDEIFLSDSFEITGKPIELMGKRSFISEVSVEHH